MAPLPVSATYTIRITLAQNCTPQVKVVDPMPLPMAKGKSEYEHINRPQEKQYLCLNLREEWNPCMYIADTFVPWTSEWLISYEGWVATGIWTGGGLHRNVYVP